MHNKDANYYDSRKLYAGTGTFACLYHDKAIYAYNFAGLITNNKVYSLEKKQRKTN